MKIIIGPYHLAESEGTTAEEWLENNERSD